MSSREEIVDKLHGALSALRRERDDSHRSKELAMERLHIAKEERETVEKTVRTMHSKLNEMQTSMNDDDLNNPNSIARLQNEVDRLDNEAKFQHSEVIGKRDKLSKLESKIIEESKVRASSLKASRDALRKRRDKNILLLSNRSINNPTEDNKNNANDVQHAAKLFEDTDLLQKLPRLVQEKSDLIDTETEEACQANESLQKRIAGYKRCLGLSASSDAGGDSFESFNQQ